MSGHCGRQGLPGLLPLQGPQLRGHQLPVLRGWGPPAGPRGVRDGQTGPAREGDHLRLHPFRPPAPKPISAETPSEKHQDPHPWDLPRPHASIIRLSCPRPVHQHVATRVFSSPLEESKRFQKVLEKGDRGTHGGPWKVTRSSTHRGRWLPATA